MSLFFSKTDCQDFEMYWNNYSIINPGNYGLTYSFQGTNQYKLQWLGMPDSPKLISTNFNCRIKSLHGGIGVNHQYEKYGAYENDFTLIGYSFHFYFKNDSRLGIGTSIGVGRYRFNNSINNFRSADSVHNSGDLATPNGNLEQINGDIRFGLAFSSKKIETGLSLRPFAKYEKAYCFGYFAYRARLSPIIKLKPGIAFKTAFNSIIGNAIDYRNIDFAEKNSSEVKFNLTLIAWDKLWLGSQYSLISGNNHDLLGFYAGYDIIEHIRIGYYFSGGNNYSFGSHEFTFSFLL